jgi:hypothetical protein
MKRFTSFSFGLFYLNIVILGITIINLNIKLYNIPNIKIFKLIICKFGIIIELFNILRISKTKIGNGKLKIYKVKKRLYN